VNCVASGLLLAISWIRGIFMRNFMFHNCLC
jgi:hypothetical protein